VSLIHPRIPVAKLHSNAAAISDDVASAGQPDKTMSTSSGLITRKQAPSPLAGKRIMWVVGYVPGKLGSFERFMEVFARQCSARGAHLTFVFRGEPLPAYADKLASAGASVHVLPMRSRLDGTFIIKLSRLVRNEHIDILHSNFDLANFGTSVVAVRTRVAAYVWHQHNFMGERFSPLRWIFLKFLNRIADRVFCVTDSMRSHLIAKGFDPRKVSRVYIGPDLELFDAKLTGQTHSFRRDFAFPDTSVVIVCVADARPEKGHLPLLQAFARIMDEYPDAHLLLVGAMEGAFTESLQREVERLNIGGRVRLTRIRNDVPRLLQEADMSVVTPTKEVSLLAIMESMAASKPVIATRVGGIPEVIIDGRSGLLVPPSDVSALAEALAQLLQNAWLRNKLGKEGRRAVEETFNTRVAATRMIGAYEEFARSL